MNFKNKYLSSNIEKKIFKKTVKLLLLYSILLSIVFLPIFEVSILYFYTNFLSEAITESLFTGFYVVFVFLVSFSINTYFIETSLVKSKTINNVNLSCYGIISFFKNKHTQPRFSIFVLLIFFSIIILFGLIAHAVLFYSLDFWGSQKLRVLGYIQDSVTGFITFIGAFYIENTIPARIVLLLTSSIFGFLYIRYISSIRKGIIESQKRKAKNKII